MLIKKVNNTKQLNTGISLAKLCMRNASDTSLFAQNWASQGNVPGLSFWEKYLQLQSPTDGGWVAEKWRNQAEEIVWFVCSPWQLDVFLWTLRQRTFIKIWGKIRIFLMQGMYFYAAVFFAATVMHARKLLHHNIGHFLLGLSRDRMRSGVLLLSQCDKAGLHMCCCSPTSTFTRILYSKENHASKICSRFLSLLPHLW